MLTDEWKVPSSSSVCSWVALVMPLFSSQWIFWPMWPGRSVASPKTVLLVVAAIWTLPVSATSWEKGWASTPWAATDGSSESTEIPVVRVKSVTQSSCFVCQEHPEKLQQNIALKPLHCSTLKCKFWFKTSAAQSNPRWSIFDLNDCAWKKSLL